jgi:hypothetical protein
MFKALLILFFAAGCTKTIRDQFPPEEKRYLIRVLITTDASLTYKCNNITYKHDGYAQDCEDNEGRPLDYLNFRANVTEIVDGQREL